MKDSIKYILPLYVVASITVIIWLSIKIVKHECKKEVVIYKKEYYEKIEEISNAEDKSTIDSLLHELYGFSTK